MTTGWTPPPTPQVAKARAIRRFWVSFMWAWLIWIAFGYVPALFLVWSLISDSSLEVALLMLEMNLLEDMGIGINMESGGEMLLDTHGSDMVAEKLLARRSMGVSRRQSAQ